MKITLPSAFLALLSMILVMHMCMATHAASPNGFVYDRSLTFAQNVQRWEHYDQLMNQVVSRAESLDFGADWISSLRQLFVLLHHPDERAAFPYDVQWHTLECYPSLDEFTLTAKNGSRRKIIITIQSLFEYATVKVTDGSRTSKVTI